MAFFDNIHFPFFTLQELNLDWLLKEVKRIAGFMPQDGNVGDILTRKSDGAAWEVPSAVTLDIASLPEDTQILDNDQLIFYDLSSQANRKIKPPNLMDSMCSNAYPLMNGTAAAGTSKKPARYDHVHPTDTTRAPASYFQNSALKVANGGTGADNAADARNNLGVLYMKKYVATMTLPAAAGSTQATLSSLGISVAADESVVILDAFAHNGNNDYWYTTIVGNSETAHTCVFLRSDGLVYAKLNSGGVADYGSQDVSIVFLIVKTA